MIIEDDAPGIPLVGVISKPATFPCRATAKFVFPDLDISSLEISCTAYPSDFFSRETPIAVTTTSSRPTRSGTRMISIRVRPSMGTSCVFMPIKLKTSVFIPCGTDRLYLPPASVKVPIVVPLTVTETPGNDNPSSWLVTVPVTCTVCPSASTAVANANTKIIKIFFIL